MAAALSPLMNSVASGAEAAGSPTQPAKRPNVLLVISDQYRWDFVCGYGRNPMDFTPNLDAMLRRGTAFENAFTNQPLCSPARSVLFTGQYATKTGVWKLTGSNISLRQDAVTLATVLGQAGYSTNYIGKWHLMRACDQSRSRLCAAGTTRWLCRSVAGVQCFGTHLASVSRHDVGRRGKPDDV